MIPRTREDANMTPKLETKLLMFVTSFPDQCECFMAPFLPVKAEVDSPETVKLSDAHVLIKWC